MKELRHRDPNLAPPDYAKRNKLDASYTNFHIEGIDRTSRRQFAQSFEFVVVRHRFRSE